MKLGARVAVILLAVVGGYALVDHLLQRWVVAPSFERLAEQEAARNLARAEGAVRARVAELDGRTAQLAARVDLARAAGEHDEDALAAALDCEVGPPAGATLVFVCASDGRVLWEQSRGPAGGPLAVRELPTGALAPSHVLLGPATDATAPVAGLLATEHGILAVASRCIGSAAAGSDERPARLILAELLDAATARELSELAQVTIELWSLDGGALPERAAAILDQVTAAAGPVIPRGPDGAGDAAVDGELAIYATLADVRAAPSVLVRAAVPGEIAAQGAAAVRYALFSTLAAGVLLLLVLLRVLDRAVVEPIARLTRHAVRVGESDALDERLALARADEIGTLSREFDRMLERLASSRAALAESARAAGQSEVATGVLHNVGNVLNSVNVSARVLGDKLSGSRLAHLERLAQLLEERRDDLVSFVREDPRGKQLVPFLSTLTRQLADERAALGEELAGLTRGVEHIGELVAAQQAYATRATLIEPTSISALVEQALALTAHVSPAGREPRVARELGVPEKLPLDRHRVLEILVNLVQNARQALAEVREPELAVRARLADGELAVEVRDNGVGIAVENLPRLFQHGFTTKPGGHGFGLHASANAATELGGKLAGASAGTGRGASFVLRLPVAPLASGAAGERRSEPAQAAPADRAA